MLQAGVTSNSINLPWEGITQGIGSLVGGIMQSGNARKAAKEQYKYNLALQQQAQQWNEYMYKHRYQMEVTDKEAAGLNMLYGLSNAPSVTSGSNSVGMPEYVAEANGKLQNALTGVQLAQDWSAKKADIKLKETQQESERINQELTEIQKLTEQEKYLERRTKNKWLPKQLENQNKYELNQIKALKRQIINSEIEEAKTKAEIGYTNIQSQTALENKNKISEETKEIERKNKWHEKHPIMSDLGQTGTEMRDAINDIKTGVDAYYRAKDVNSRIKNINRKGTAKKKAKSRNTQVEE